MGIEVTMKEEKEEEEEVTSDNEVEMSPSKSNDSEVLFDDSVIFQFYSKSRNVPPGKGSGETIPPQMKDSFDELGKIKNWRHHLTLQHVSFLYEHLFSRNRARPLFNLNLYRSIQNHQFLSLRTRLIRNHHYF